MANIKISDLPLIANITPSSGEFPIVYNNVTYKMNWSQLNNQITASGANPLNVTGTGTTGNITKWTTGGSVIGDSLITDNGSVVTITSNADIDGTLNVTETLTVDKTATSAIEIAKFKVSGTGGTNGNESFVSILPGSSNFTTQLRLNTNNTGNNFQTVSNKSGILELATTDSNSIVFKTNNSTRLTIDGVGVSTFTNNIKIPNSGTIGSVSAADAITILSGGQVGIKGTPSYDFHVFGNILAITGSNAVLRLIGTAGNAKLFDLKNDNGVFSIRDVNNGKDMYQTDPTSNGFHKWYINDVQKMTLDSSGNVGIGVSPVGISSFTTLHIEGATGGGIKIGKTGQSQMNIQHDGSDGYINNTASGNLFFYTADNPRLTISSNGNIGQAVTPISDPYISGAEQWMTYQIGKGGVMGAYKANNESMFGFNTYVSAPSGANKAIISGMNGSAIRYYADRMTFNFLTSSGTAQTQTEAMRITSGGDVGIGTTSPSRLLQVGGLSNIDGDVQIGGTASSLGLRLNYDQGGSTVSNIYNQYDGNPASKINFGFGTTLGSNVALSLLQSGVATFSSTIVTSGNVEAPRFTAGTYPYNSILGSGADAGTTTVEAGSTTGYRSAIKVNGGGSASPNTMQFITTSYERMSINNVGQVYINNACRVAGLYITDLQGNAQLTNASTSSGSNPSYIGQGLISVSVSDIKAKENIGNVEDNECLNQIKSLANHVKKFDWKDKDWKKEKGRTIGMVAQEIYEEFPQHVHKPKNYEDEGWAIRYQEIVPILTKAIQEQQTIIDGLKSRIDILENN